jgi:tryptophanyl-tRNA synthetase
VPSFKQYREKDGLFYFKLVDAKGQILLQSLGFASPKEAGQTISRLQTEGPNVLVSLKPVAGKVEDYRRSNIRHLFRYLQNIGQAIFQGFDDDLSLRGIRVYISRSIAIDR